MAGFEKIDLEKIRVGVLQRIGPYWGQDCDLTMVEDHMAEQFAISLRSFCWAEQQREVVAAEWPADWWQAVKERFAPKWFLKRWPVKYDKAGITARVAYTKLPYHFPKERSIVQFVKRVEGDDE